MDRGARLKLELPSQLLVFLPPSHYFRECLMNVLVRNRIVYGIGLQLLLDPLVLIVCVPKSADSPIIWQRLIVIVRRDHGLV